MDDLLDLNWSSTSNPTSLPPAQNGNTIDAFDLLSRPKGSSNLPSYSTTPVLRPSTPNTAPLQSASHLSQPMRSTLSGSTTPIIEPSASDAFSRLLSIKPTSDSSKTLSLADRQRKLEEERRQREEHERQQYQAHGSFWEALGDQQNHAASSSSPRALQAPTPMQRPRPSYSPPVLIPSPGPAIVQNESGRPLAQATNGAAARMAPSPAPPQPTLLTPTIEFDGLSSKRTTSSSGAGSGMRTPVSDFDFGDDELDILEEYKPAVQTRATSKSPSRRPEQSPSLPPHIVGQIVEMGFSPDQAREALGKTSTGLDVQAALELLLVPQADIGATDDEQVLAERSRREEEEKARRRRRRAGPSRDSVKARTKEQQADDVMADQLSEQAERMYAQASAFGQSALSKATSLWHSSKERALKAYEEQLRAKEAGTRPPRVNGRPRWMVNADDDEGLPKASLSRQREEMASMTSRIPNPPGNSRVPARPVDGSRSRPTKSRNDALFADEPEDYTRVTPRGSPLPVQQARAAPLPTRPLVAASSSQIESCSIAKAKGNEHFRLGRFAEAEAAYTSAVSTLPEGHLLLVPVLNNRAAARLKLGQPASAIEDCSTVISLIGPSYHPSKEAPLPASLSEVKLSDALVKATIKRAQAFEINEKYQLALQDWETVLSFDAAVLGSAWSTARNLAAEGARRVRGQLQPKPTKHDSQPTQPARPTHPIDLSKSAAVSELRKIAQAASVEDEARIAAKDLVDAKLNAWKGGKEANLRALIASLDSVLWDEILSGGLKVGIHELITEKQVKVKYMKVIARLHPDKLNTQNTTVEQRMLANGAFSILNEAWQAFNNA